MSRSHCVNKRYSWLFRAAAVALVPGQVLLAIPLAAADVLAPRDAAKEAVSAPAPPVAPPVVVNKTTPKVTAPPMLPELSALPTDREIFRARVFDEPLVPMGGEASLGENRLLADALLAYLRTGGADDVSTILRFLEDYPSSRWSASLWTGLGVVYRRTGYYSRALEAWERAWALAKDETAPRPKAIADRAVAELAELNARLGRFDRLERLFKEIEGRNIGGAAAEKISGARTGYWQMKNTPDQAFRCGPLSLDRILAATRKAEYRLDPLVVDARSTQRGTSLLQMRDLSRRLGLNFQMARRTIASADPLVPSMVHWRAGHFAAMVRFENGRYLLQDPTFGRETWVTRAALDEESSGSFLVPEGPLPTGWTPMADDEGAQVWGKGATTINNPQEYTPQAPQAPNTCENQPMAAYSIHLMLVSLQVRDTPVRYTPPVGPEVSFTVRYNQREVFQPQIPSYGNFGPKWTYDWLSYVEDDPTNLSADVNVYIRGGGQETYSGFDPGTQSYAPHMESHAVIVRSVISPIKYRRRLPDGSVEIYGQPDGATNSPRRVFLTALRDPQGNQVNFTYDQYFRLVAATDPLGQVTSLGYDPVDYLKITKITDPFGRSATFEYNGSGQLYRITDPIGIQSSFTYSAGDTLSSMTTPYGTTTFSVGEAGIQRWVDVTDPLGGKERVEFRHEAPGIGNTEQFVPGGLPLPLTNGLLQYRNTFYWDKRASAMYPGDYTKARLTHWLHTLDTNVASGVIESTKAPLENRVWYEYPGQTGYTYTVGTSGLPSAVARVLDDGVTTQMRQYEYNSRGLVTKATDPMARVTRYTYGTNNVADADPTTGSGLDLLKVEQKNGAGYDLLETRTYNTQHEPLTVMDAAGQTTTYTYNTAGQILTVTTPPRAGINENRTTTFTYDANGYLQSVTRPATGSTTTYTYDAFGRARTVTDSEGYVITTDYDALDRPTKVTFPDGTYEQTAYNRLDAQDRRDRLGRWSHVLYDELRRPTSLRDALGRTTTQEWCTCGSMDKVIDASNHATSWDRDLQGRVTTETKADGSVASFSYETTTSRLKTRTDAKGQVTTYSYTTDNALAQKAYTNAAITTPMVSFTYDPIYPRLATMGDGTGTTQYGYYTVAVPPTLGAGRLQSVNGPLANDTVSYAYDELGRVTTRGLAAFQYTTSYDALGRPSPILSPVGSFSWTFVNTTDRPQTLTYPNGQVTNYTYFDNVGDQRLREIKHQQMTGGTVLSQFDYTYDPVGNVSTWQQQLGASGAKVYTLGYDAANQLTSAMQRDLSTQQILKNYGYAYDGSGNRTMNAQDSTATTSQYNSRNELTQQVGGGLLPVAGVLSEPAAVTVGAIPATVTATNQFAGSAQVGSGTQTFSVTATDPNHNTRTNTYQVTVSGVGETFVYDANGNLCAKGGTTCTNGTTTYDWDAENRLVAVKQGATTLASFTYDAIGRRATKTAGGVTTTYVYDGAQFIEERPGAGTVKRYVYGPGIDRPLAQVIASATSYFVADHLGSIVQVTDGSGAPTLVREYDASGNLLQGASTNGYGFTGREWDAETGLAYYRARYYDPKSGRFLSEDPIGFEGGTNFYSYVWDNPVNSIDPSGMRIQVCSRQAGGSLAVFNHVYFWNPDTKENCGRGPRSGQESGPGPGTTCVDVPGSEDPTTTKALMQCCRATAQRDSSLPGIHTLPLDNDCHNILQNCVAKQRLKYPSGAGGRVGPRGCCIVEPRSRPGI
jgi:RHS repeat-associated protein